jgi:hypothetical protein
MSAFRSAGADHLADDQDFFSLLVFFLAAWP